MFFLRLNCTVLCSPGRLTPIDTSLNSAKGGGRVTTGHAGHVSGHVYSSANGLLNVSSHNSSKLSSSNSGSNVTKTTVDLSLHGAGGVRTRMVCVHAPA